VWVKGSRQGIPPCGEFDNISIYSFFFYTARKNPFSLIGKTDAREMVEK